MSVRVTTRCLKQDPHFWSGRDALKHLHVGSMPFPLAKSLGKGQGGTETFVPLKPVPDMSRQPPLRTHMGDLWSVNAATTRHQPKLVVVCDCSTAYCRIGKDSVRF